MSTDKTIKICNVRGNNYNHKQFDVTVYTENEDLEKTWISNATSPIQVWITKYNTASLKIKWGRKIKSSSNSRGQFHIII